MFKKLLTISIFILIPCIAFAFTIECEYPNDVQICNGYKLKEECKDKGYDVSYILQLGYGYVWLNDKAKREYHKMIDCIEYVGTPNEE